MEKSTLAATSFTDTLTKDGKMLRFFNKYNTKGPSRDPSVGCYILIIHLIQSSSLQLSASLIPLWKLD